MAGATLETNVKDPTNTSKECLDVDCSSKNDRRSASMLSFLFFVMESVKLSRLTRIPVTTAIDSNHFPFFSAKMIPRYEAQRRMRVMVW